MTSLTFPSLARTNVSCASDDIEEELITRGCMKREARLTGRLNEELSVLGGDVEEEVRRQRVSADVVRQRGWIDGDRFAREDLRFARGFSRAPDFGMLKPGKSCCTGSSSVTSPRCIASASSSAVKVFVTEPISKMVLPSGFGSPNPPLHCVPLARLR
jgi:hypothetical protein